MKQQQEEEKEESLHTGSCRGPALHPPLVISRGRAPPALHHPPCDQPKSGAAPRPAAGQEDRRSTIRSSLTKADRKQSSSPQKGKKKVPTDQQVSRRPPPPPLLPAWTPLLLHPQAAPPPPPPLENGVRWPPRPGREHRGAACRGRAHRWDCWGSDRRSCERPRAQSQN